MKRPAINVCNRGEYCETPCIRVSRTGTAISYNASLSSTGLCKNSDKKTT